MRRTKNARVYFIFDSASPVFSGDSLRRENGDAVNAPCWLVAVEIHIWETGEKANCTTVDGRIANDTEIWRIKGCYVRALPANLTDERMLSERFAGCQGVDFEPGNIPRKLAQTIGGSRE